MFTEKMPKIPKMPIGLFKKKVTLNDIRKVIIIETFLLARYIIKQLIQKNTNYIVLYIINFNIFLFFSGILFWKSEKWTFINVHFSKMQK